MKKFLLKASIFIAIQLAIGAVLTKSYFSQNQYGYMAAFEDKLALLKAPSDPRLVLLGGSNVAFGFDSERLSEQMNLPVVNAGLHAALGLDFYLALAEKHSRKGDVVVLIPEWAMMSGLFSPEEIQLKQLLRASPSAWSFDFASDRIETKAFFDHMALQEFASMIQDGAKFRTDSETKRAITNARRPGKYSRLNFNSSGDFIGHRSLGTTKDISSLPFSVVFRKGRFEKTVTRINELASLLEERGVRLCLAYPPTPKPFAEKCATEISLCHEFLRQRLEIPILHEPQKSSYPVNHFFDTVYHLNGKGTAKRTGLLIRSLKQHPEMQHPEIASRHNSTNPSQKRQGGKNGAFAR